MTRVPDIRRTVGSHELVARQDAHGWRVEIGAFTWASGLSERGARACMDLLERSHKVRRIGGAAAASMNRHPCPICGRSVGVTSDGIVGWHFPKEWQPGQEQKVCLGWGEKVSP